MTVSVSPNPSTQSLAKSHWHGLVLLDKPTNISSNGVLQIVKKIFNVKKAGHTGSLDPLASGMLPICLNDATPFSQFLLLADKHYYVTAKLGVKTTTGDAEGAVVSERPIDGITLAQVQAALPSFRGLIQQIPSMYSALKHQGKPLYKLARQGLEVPREARPVTIHTLTLQDFADGMLTLDIRCSKGTYVRTLIEDIGEALGCGAHVASLRRLGVGSFQAQQMVSVAQLDEAKRLGSLQDHILSIDSAMSAWPAIQLAAVTQYYLSQGQPIMTAAAQGLSGWVRLHGEDQRFIGIGEIVAPGKVAPRRLLKRR
jgi:tRNA pseudouridine55 synthase